VSLLLHRGNDDFRQQPSPTLGKEAFYAQIELDEHTAYDLTKAVKAMNACADDAQEGMCAFLEKRPATWRRR
jgi:enoyl-CoA hydratase/carnithine racemase